MKKLKYIFFFLLLWSSLLSAQSTHSKTLKYSDIASFKFILTKYINKLKTRKSSLLRSNYRVCQLHSTQFSDLAKKLKNLKEEFKNKTCLNKMGGTINQLGNSINKFEEIQTQIKKEKIDKENFEDQINKLNDPNYKKKRTEVIELEDKRRLALRVKRMKFVSDSISSMARLASFTECQNDLKNPET